MPSNRIRADYESLKQIAQVFGQQADATRQSLQQIKQAVDTLQQGDWIGKGADKFYGEMATAIMPSVTRLQNALENAARVTNQISGVMKRAEDEAARVLRGNGNGGAPSGGAGGPGGGTTPQPGGDAGGTGGSSGGSSGGASGGGSSGGGASGGGSGSATGTPTSRMLKNLDPKVAEAAEKSPTLKTQLEKLEQEGWTIVKGTPGGGSKADRVNKQLIIDPANSPEYQVGSVAHEGAHALYGSPPYHAPTATMTKDEYVNLNVNEALRDEGNAQFNRSTVRAEVKAAGGPDILMSGTKSAEYETIYADFKAGTITKDQAIEKMGNTVGTDVTGTTGENYRDYYGKTYKDFWDANIAPGRRTP